MRTWRTRLLWTQPFKRKQSSGPSYVLAPVYQGQNLLDLQLLIPEPLHHRRCCLWSTSITNDHGPGKPWWNPRICGNPSLHDRPPNGRTRIAICCGRVQRSEEGFLGPSCHLHRMHDGTFSSHVRRRRRSGSAVHWWTCWWNFRSRMGCTF